MATLTLKSERQIQTQMLATLIAQLGLNDINPGSVIDILTQAAAQSDFALYYQIAQVSRLADLEAMTGNELDLKGFEYGLFRRAAEKATGLITIQRPDSFVKVATSFYAGFPSPIAGDLTIYVNDASSVLISTSGTLVLGRGTNNEEEVTYSAAPVDNINYFTFTLDAPLANNHATEESVILKQGSDESIVAGTIVVVPATGTTTEIQFATVNDEVLLSGESEVTGVEVIAVSAGTDGNIASMSISGISAFSSPPFSGARAVNPSKFTTGQDRETDDQFRDRIKDAVPALSRGIKQAILNAVVGIVDPVSAKRVVSASVVLPVAEAGAVKVYIDDGTGFEPTFESVGFETIKANSSGGEQRFQLDHFPDVKAQLENNLSEPFDFSSGSKTLSYEVGSVSETITFNLSDFRFPDLATAEEIAAAINDKASLVEARTSQNGKRVTLTARVDVNESILITGGTANAILAFPTDRKDTLNLYVDDVKLSKDGETAILDSQNSAPFNLLAIGAYPHELNIIVDGKSANPQVATVNLVDVSDSAAVTVAEICAVLNRDLAGVTATPAFSNTKVRLESNTKLSALSKLEITGGSLNDASDGLNFSTVEKVGVAGDYIFNRELGLIELTTPLSADQTVTSGSLFTRGKLRAGSAELYSPSNGQTLVISVDGGGDQTVTFDGSFVAGKSAQDTADFINLQLLGAKAVARTIGLLNYLEIRTNTFDVSGSIEIKGASTANAAFSFDLDVEVFSDIPNKAFKVSIAEPFAFAEDQVLVVVMNDDIVNSTFSIVFTVPRTATSGASTTVFADSGLGTVFPTTGELIDYFVAFVSGANTTSEVVITAAVMGGGVVRYTFSAAPANFVDYVVGDLARITGLVDPENNRNGVILAKGADWIEIDNPDGVNASGQSGLGLLSQKRSVTAYNSGTGQITVGVAFTDTPAAADEFLVIPSTANNVVEFLNNTKITSLSLKADVEGVDDNSKVQIASKLDGSDGYVQVTGGSANQVLEFDTELFRGLAGYQYWTGLIDLVHRVIYGDDTDLVSFPGIGASGVIFRFLAPTVRDISIELDVTLREGISITSLENEIRSAVTGYVNNLGVGEDVIIEEIRSAVISIAGVTDVSISEPVANIAIADNELARVSDSAILIG